MKRIFNAHIQLAYEDERVSASVNSPFASRTGFWWNERKPGGQGLWDNRIELGEKFFNEIIRHPVPLDLNILKAPQALFAGIGSLSVVDVSDFHIETPATALLAAVVPPVRSAPHQGEGSLYRQGFFARIACGS